MSVDWFTVLAQGINFLALVWLLKRFLYKPILDAIDERERNIVVRLEEAAAQKTEATREREEFRHKNETFERQKRELLEAAHTDSQRHRDQLMEEAREEANSLRLLQKEALSDFKQDFQDRLAQRMTHEIIETSRKVLQDLASVDLEQEVVRYFLARLRGLSAAESRPFLDAGPGGEGQAVVNSAFALPERQRAEINRAVSDLSGGVIECRFNVSPELIGGIELVANGYKLAWDVSAYLTSLQDELSESLRSPSTAEKTDTINKKIPRSNPIAS